MSCKFCKHYLFNGCKAFDRIPMAFASGEKIHDKPTKGQKGDFVFERGTNEVLDYEALRLKELTPEG